MLVLGTLPAFFVVMRPDSSSTVPRLLLLHGLEGTIRSHYLRGMLARAQELGWAADILIFRGCNGTVPRGPTGVPVGTFVEFVRGRAG